MVDSIDGRCLNAGIARPLGNAKVPVAVCLALSGTALGATVKILVTSPPRTRWVFRADEKPAPRKTA